VSKIKNELSLCALCFNASGTTFCPVLPLILIIDNFGNSAKQAGKGCRFGLSGSDKNFNSFKLQILSGILDTQPTRCNALNCLKSPILSGSGKLN